MSHHSPLSKPPRFPSSPPSSYSSSIPRSPSLSLPPTNTFRKRIYSSSAKKFPSTSLFLCRLSLFNYASQPEKSYEWSLALQNCPSKTGKRNDSQFVYSFECDEKRYQEMVGRDGKKKMSGKAAPRRRRTSSMRGSRRSSSPASRMSSTLSRDQLFKIIRDALFGLNTSLRFKIYFVSSKTRWKDVLGSAQYRKDLMKRSWRKKDHDKLFIKIWRTDKEAEDSVPIGSKRFWILLEPGMVELDTAFSDASILPHLSTASHIPLSPQTPSAFQHLKRSNSSLGFSSSPSSNGHSSSVPHRSSSSLAKTPTRSSPVKSFSLQNTPLSHKRKSTTSSTTSNRRNSMFSRRSNLSQSPPCQKRKSLSVHTNKSRSKRSPSTPQSPTPADPPQPPPLDSSHMLQLIEAYFRAEKQHSIARSSSPIPFSDHQSTPMRVTERSSSPLLQMGVDSPVRLRSSSPSNNGSRFSSAYFSSSRSYRYIAEHLAAKNPRTKDAMLHLQRLDQWDFDVFVLDHILNSENLLVFVSYALFLKYDLLTKFQIRDGVFINFVKLIENSYRTNPYHNVLHSVDSLHMIHFAISSGELSAYLSDDEILVAFLAPVILDSSFLSVEKEKYERRRSSSPSENGKQQNPSDALFETLCFNNPACNIFGGMTDEQQRRILRGVSKMFLATDRSYHPTILHNLRDRIESHVDLRAKENVYLILQATFRLSDLAYTMKPRKLYLKWAERVFYEFHLQNASTGTQKHTWEAQRQFLSKAQIGLINYMVSPLLEVFCELLPNMRIALSSLTQNKYYWLSLQGE